MQPKLDSSIQDYVRTKIEDSETRLLQDALQLKVHLQATDNLPSNGVLPVKRRPTAHFAGARRTEAAYTTFDSGLDSNQDSSQLPQSSMKRLIVSK